MYIAKDGMSAYITIPYWVF